MEMSDVHWITEHIYVGNIDTARDEDRLRNTGITHMKTNDIHCVAGRNRSGAMVTAWLMLREDLDYPTALSKVRLQRFDVNPYTFMRDQVLRYFDHLNT